MLHYCYGVYVLLPEDGTLIEFKPYIFQDEQEAIDFAIKEARYANREIMGEYVEFDEENRDVNVYNIEGKLTAIYHVAEFYFYPHKN